LRSQLIVKYAAYPPCYIPMFDKEVIVRPGFKLFVEAILMSIAHFLQCLMEITSIVFLHIVWCQVDATAKPTNLVIQLKIANIHVDNRHMRIIGVYHDRHSGSEKVFGINTKGFLYRFRQLAVYGR